MIPRETERKLVDSKEEKRRRRLERTSEQCYREGKSYKGYTGPSRTSHRGRIYVLRPDLFHSLTYPLVSMMCRHLLSFTMTILSHLSQTTSNGTLGLFPHSYNLSFLNLPSTNTTPSLETAICPTASLEENIADTNDHVLSHGRPDTIV